MDSSHWPKPEVAVLDVRRIFTLGLSYSVNMLGIGGLSLLDPIHGIGGFWFLRLRPSSTPSLCHLHECSAVPPRALFDDKCVDYTL